MKIVVERDYKENGDMVFTIRVSKPHKVFLKEKETEILDSIDVFNKQMCDKLGRDSVVYARILDSNHEIKGEIFDSVLRSLHSTIEFDLEYNFKPMVQEIYNWIVDHQEDYVKKWMAEFDPERTKYYFSNDPKMTAQQPNLNPDDKFDDEEEDEI